MEDGELAQGGPAFRRMYAAPDRFPVVGNRRDQLGVRYIAPESGLPGNSDITPDTSGHVSRACVGEDGRPSGMSVLLEVPTHGVGHGRGGFAGVGKPGGKAPPVYFAADLAALREGLETVYSGADPSWLHAVVRPTDPVPLEAYRAALARTRERWRMRT